LSSERERSDRLQLTAGSTYLEAVAPLPFDNPKKVNAVCARKAAVRLCTNGDQNSFDGAQYITADTIREPRKIRGSLEVAPSYCVMWISSSLFT